MAAHSAGTRAIPPVPNDQPPPAWDQWLRDMAQSLNLISLWIGTHAGPSYQAGSGIAIDNGTTPPTISTAVPYLPLTGGTLTGTLTIANTVGGGYGGQFGLTNTSAGATNINKTFRLSPTGTLELINSAFTAVVFQFTDSGDFILQNNAAFRGKKTDNTIIALAYVGTDNNIRLGVEGATNCFIGTGGSYFATDGSFYPAAHTILKNGFSLYSFNASGTNAYPLIGVASDNRLKINSPAAYNVDAYGTWTFASSLSALDITSNGTSAIFAFADRAGAASGAWGWYASGGIARLWNIGSGDRVTVDTAGYAKFDATGLTAGPAAIYCGTAPDVSFGLIRGTGTTRLLNFNQNCWLVYDTSNGNLAYNVNGTTCFVYRFATDDLFYNNLAPMGGNGAYVNFSDRRMKELIEPTKKGLDVILALTPVEFVRLPPAEVKGEHEAKANRPAPRREIGFIAQDLVPVLPEAVSVAGIELPDGRGGLDDAEPSLGITSETIVAVLVNAVQELHARVASLEGRTIQ